MKLKCIKDMFYDEFIKTDEITGEGFYEKGDTLGFKKGNIYDLYIGNLYPHIIDEEGDKNEFDDEDGIREFLNEYFEFISF